MVLCDFDLIGDGLEGRFENAARAILLVAPRQRAALQTIANSNFDGYLIKPIRHQTLIREVSRQRRAKDDLASVIASNRSGASSDTPAGNGAVPGKRDGNRDAQSNAKPGRQRDSGDQIGALKILLAEDNQINAVLATALIKKAGHRVDVAVNGARAIEAVKDGSYDLIFMDMHMPEMDGVEAARQIRALAAPYNNIPIVALTANAMASDRQKCIAAGMDDFLPKPFEPADLEAMVEKWGSGREALTAAS